jgi:hypothetical protein
MKYNVAIIDPSNQLVLPLERHIDTTITDKINRITSKCGKFRVIGLSTYHPTTTAKGATRIEI